MGLDELVPKLLKDKYGNASIDTLGNIIGSLIKRINEWNEKNFTVDDYNIKRFYFTFLLEHEVTTAALQSLVDKDKNVRILDFHELYNPNATPTKQYPTIRARIDEGTAEITRHLRVIGLLEVAQGISIEGQKINVYKINQGVFRDYKSQLNGLHG